ncbi:MAG: type II toxin-antitoxin system VapC family toxin [Nanoarchaeota archaeon]
MYCLDTNIIVDILRGDRLLAEKVDNTFEKGFDIFITPISLCELYRGAYGHQNSAKKVEELNAFIFNLRIIGFDIESCKEFGKEYSRLNKIGKQTKEFDLLIACIVKVNELILVTRDKKDFENIDVNIEVW